MEKYFGYKDGRNWVFTDFNTGKSIKAYAKHKVKTGSYARVGYQDVLPAQRKNRPLRVGYDRSYYDGDTAYWADRLSKGYGDITPAKAKMLKKQNGICPYCNSRLTNEDLLEAHHKKYRARGGEDKYHNFVLLHRHCHDALHREQTRKHREHSQFIGGGVDQRVWY
ncbi:MAG: HNH endonuclease signature motif containing protein [Pseudomonadota bacterium]